MFWPGHILLAKLDIIIPVRQNKIKNKSSYDIFLLYRINIGGDHQTSSLKT
jgi:hypothetical protein